MYNLNLKGIWIPIEILTDEKLSDKKIIYAIILYLSKENSYCYLTNKTISELLNVSITQVSKLVNSLKYKKYIDIELIYVVVCFTAHFEKVFLGEFKEEILFV